jgi:hypothetical protein
MTQIRMSSVHVKVDILYKYSHIEEGHESGPVIGLNRPDRILLVSLLMYPQPRFTVNQYPDRVLPFWISPSLKGG